MYFVNTKDSYPIKEYIYESNKKYDIRFCFVTTSYNQSQFIIDNLDSIRKQNYKNYYVNYVNDGSTDDTQEILLKYQNKYPKFPLTIIVNSKRYGPAYSRKLSYMNAENEDVCVFLDGDDFLVGNNVLQILSEAYDTYDVYATFGSMKDNYWQYKSSKSYYDRKKKNYFPHLRTVKSKILKQIPDSYLKDSENNWFMFTTDVALFTAVIELCGKKKYMFLENEIVIYNQHNNLNNKKDGYVNQTDKGKKIRTYYHEVITNMLPLEIYEGFNNNSYVCYNTFILIILFCIYKKLKI